MRMKRATPSSCVCRGVRAASAQPRPGRDTDGGRRPRRLRPRARRRLPADATCPPRARLRLMHHDRQSIDPSATAGESARIVSPSGVARNPRAEPRNRQHYSGDSPPRQSRRAIPTSGQIIACCQGSRPPRGLSAWAFLIAARSRHAYIVIKRNCKNKTKTNKKKITKKVRKEQTTEKKAQRQKSNKKRKKNGINREKKKKPSERRSNKTNRQNKKEKRKKRKNGRKKIALEPRRKN